MSKHCILKQIVWIFLKNKRPFGRLILLLFFILFYFITKKRVFWLNFFFIFFYYFLFSIFLYYIHLKIKRNFWIYKTNKLTLHDIYLQMNDVMTSHEFIYIYQYYVTWWRHHIFFRMPKIFFYCRKSFFINKRKKKIFFEKISFYPTLVMLYSWHKSIPYP